MQSFKVKNNGAVLSRVAFDLLNHAFEVKSVKMLIQEVLDEKQVNTSSSGALVKVVESMNRYAPVSLSSFSKFHIILDNVCVIDCLPNEEMLIELTFHPTAVRQYDENMALKLLGSNQCYEIGIKTGGV
jgi:hypothetical protein